MDFTHIKDYLPCLSKRRLVRVLGLDPTYCGCAYAALDGQSDLVDWGTTETKFPVIPRILSLTEKVIDRTHPDLIAVEDGRSTRRGDKAKAIIAGIERVAKSRKIAVVRVTRTRVRDVFSPAITKQQIAESLLRGFPELEPRLPRPRKQCHENEDRRMNVFDALSFAVAAQVQ